MSRMTREMFCLMEGRHVHPSTLYPGGVGTVPSVQLFTDFLVRLMKYIEFMKKVVPLHDDLFDFFYEALPGYEAVGQRRILLGCWGSFQDPDVCDYNYKTMEEWGKAITLVALTGWGQESDRRRSQEAGFDTHLVKPLDLEKLTALLAQLPAHAAAPVPAEMPLQ